MKTREDYFDRTHSEVLEENAIMKWIIRELEKKESVLEEAMKKISKLDYDYATDALVIAKNALRKYEKGGSDE